MVLHASLTGAHLHEPKGVDAASIDTVYSANGAGSGAWVKIDSANIDTTSIFDVNKSYLTSFFTDISTAQTIYFVFPFAATVTRITTVLAGAITVADSVISLTKVGGGSLGTITVAFTGSAEGDVDQLTPVANNTFTANQWFKMINDGGSTTAQRVDIIVEFTRTA